MSHQGSTYSNSIGNTLHNMTLKFLKQGNSLFFYLTIGLHFISAIKPPLWNFFDIDILQFTFNTHPNQILGGNFELASSVQLRIRSIGQFYRILRNTFPIGRERGLLISQYISRYLQISKIFRNNAQLSDTPIRKFYVSNRVMCNHEAFFFFLAERCS